MSKKQLTIILSVTTIVLLGVSGCYTKLATPKRDYKHPKEQVAIDSNGDTVKIITKTDTVSTTEREICIWERDFAGFPRLRCFESHYSQDYHMYSVPWWYRNDPYYSRGYCPPNYYYDYHRGICRYIWDSTPPIEENPSSQPKSSDPPARRPRVQGLENSEPASSHSSSQTEASAPISPAPLITNDSKSDSSSSKSLQRESEKEDNNRSQSSDSEKKEKSSPVKRRNPRSF